MNTPTPEPTPAQSAVTRPLELAAAATCAVAARSNVARRIVAHQTAQALLDAAKAHLHRAEVALKDIRSTL